MANCTGCNSCQSCDGGCQTCNSCQSIACNTKQTLCKVCEYATEYGEGNPWTGLCFEKNQFITYQNLTSQKIKNAYIWMEQACKAGNSSLAGGITSNWSGNISNYIALAAEETKTLASGLKELSVIISTKNPGDLIEGTYFDEIRKKMNEAKISQTACNTCNSGCQAVCNTCNTCEQCQNCNSITYCGQYCGQYCGLTPPPTPPPTPDSGGD